MIDYSKNQKSIWLALPILAAFIFSAPLWSEETVEKTEEKSAQSLPENNSQGNQKPETTNDSKADDFKPSEEISEDFPVPLPSDI
jgi:hypothetical protein